MVVILGCNMHYRKKLCSPHWVGLIQWSYITIFQDLFDFGARGPEPKMTLQWKNWKSLTRYQTLLQLRLSWKSYSTLHNSFSKYEQWRENKCCTIFPMAGTLCAAAAQIQRMRAYGGGDRCVDSTIFLLATPLIFSSTF